MLKVGLYHGEVNEMTEALLPFRQLEVLRHSSTNRIQISVICGLVPPRGTWLLQLKYRWVALWVLWLPKLPISRGKFRSLVVTL